MKILTVSWISNANDTVTNAAPECGARMRRTAHARRQRTTYFVIYARR